MIDDPRSLIGIDSLLHTEICTFDLSMIIENYLVIMLIDCRTLSCVFIFILCFRAAFIWKVYYWFFLGGGGDFVHFTFFFFHSRACIFPPIFKRGVLAGSGRPINPNTPWFVPRESSSFTIHEFIMGTRHIPRGHCY